MNIIAISSKVSEEERRSHSIICSTVSSLYDATKPWNVTFFNPFVREGKILR